MGRKAGHYALNKSTAGLGGRQPVCRPSIMGLNRMVRFDPEETRLVWGLMIDVQCLQLAIKGLASDAENFCRLGPPPIDKIEDFENVVAFDFA